MASLLPDVAVEVEIAFQELAEALGLRQDDIPHADYILTKLALECLKKGMVKEAQRYRHKSTNRGFPAPREDDTQKVVVLCEKDLLPE